MKDDSLQQSQSSKSNDEPDSASADETFSSPGNETLPDKPVPPAPQTITVSTDEISPSQPEAASSPDNDDHTHAVQPAVSSGPKKKVKGLYIALLVLVVVAALAGISYVIANLTKTTPQATVVVKKDIADMKIDMLAEGLPSSYYPNIEDESNIVVLNMQMFEGLTKFEDGSTIVPDLALSWTNPNTSTWVFKLRSNVQFHTGRTMTATDVKASIEAVESTSWGQEFASTIKSIAVVDPLTVQINTKGPDPLMLNELTRLYIYDTTSGKTNDPINGTGPYNLDVAGSTSNDIKLVAFNNYWGGHVYTRQVDFLGYVAGSDIPTSLLTSKQMQVMTIPTDPAFAATLKTYGYQESTQSNYAVGQLVFDTRNAKSPLANVAVRKAIAEALNKPELINVSNNTGDPTANQVVPPGIPGYNPSIQSVSYSVTKAKADLTAAGYPNGFSFTFTYHGSTGNQALANELQKELAAIGITLNLNPMSDINAYGNIVENGGADMYYGVLSSDYVDGSDIMSFYVDSPYYSNPALDKLNTEASQTLDQSKRVQLLQQMNAIIASDQANIPIFVRSSQVIAVAPNIVIIHDTNAVQEMDTYFYHDYQK